MLDETEVTILVGGGAEEEEEITEERFAFRKSFDLGKGLFKGGLKVVSVLLSERRITTGGLGRTEGILKGGVTGRISTPTSLEGEGGGTGQGMSTAEE